jgi:hypothetical protein
MSLIELYTAADRSCRLAELSVEEQVLRQDKRAPIDGYSACWAKRVHDVLLAARFHVLCDPRELDVKTGFEGRCQGGLPCFSGACCMVANVAPQGVLSSPTNSLSTLSPCCSANAPHKK